jgi:LuxR family maltose regulon positive regulatory protein
MFYNASMSAPILATKLYLPPPRPKVVLRPRLIERLNEGLQRTAGVTLISAAAGFGKTTLISEWVNQKAESGTQWPAATRTRARRKDESSAPTFQPSHRTATTQWVQVSLILHPFKVAWLSLDEGDNDLARFLTYLVAA